MPAANYILTAASSTVLEFLSVPIFFVVPTTMPPLSVFENLKHAKYSMSNLKYGQLLDISLAVLLTVTVVWFAVTCVLQRKSRVVAAVVEDPEKHVTKHLLKRHDSAMHQQHWENDHNDHLNSLKQEILQHTEKPIHPWILPPQALPGPYDPMYYPLPAPTIRYKPSVPSAANLEGRHSTSYTHIVPSTCAPQNEAILYGTLTTSTNGWRRAHWNVTGG